MAKDKKISYKNLPVRWPLWSSITTWLLLDRLQPPGWVWGAVGCVFALLWIILIIAFFTEEHVDIFKGR